MTEIDKGTTKEVEIADGSTKIYITNGIKKIRYIRSDSWTARLRRDIIFIFDKDFDSNDKIDMNISFLCENLQESRIYFDFNNLKQLHQIHNAITLAKKIYTTIKEESEDTKVTKWGGNMEVDTKVITWVDITKRPKFIEYLKSQNFIIKDFENVGILDYILDKMYNDKYELCDNFYYAIKYLDASLRKVEPDKSELEEIEKSKEAKLKAEQKKLKENEINKGTTKEVVIHPFCYKDVIVNITNGINNIEYTLTDSTNRLYNKDILFVFDENFDSDYEININSN